MNKCDVITSIIHVAGCLFISVISTFFNVSSKLLLLDLCVFSALSFSRSEIQQTSKFSGVSIIRIKNNI